MPESLDNRLPLTDILMTGGGAMNIGLRRAFEDELMRDVYVAAYPQFNGAIGAALIACERRL